MEKFGVIVDGYSSGKYYPPEFKKYGVQCLHIKSRENIPSFITGCFCDSAYHATSVHKSTEETLSWIRTFGEPLFVIPGCEIGVNLADTLAAELELANANPIEMTSARRNKYLMLETLRNSGIRAIKQLHTRDVTDAYHWIENGGLTFPVVVKPLQSTSGEGFALCKSHEDVAKAFNRILSSNNLLNIENQSVLVQEYISGDEYVVDTVSAAGTHVVSDFLKYRKSFTEEGSTIYNASEFLPRNHELAQTLSKYVFQVLDALKIINGPSHAEVMVDDSGPVLIEVGARPAGCMLDPGLIERIYGHSQLSLSAMSYCDPDQFICSISKIKTELNSHMTLVFLSCLYEGYVQQVNVEMVRSLQSFCKIDTHVKIGEFAKKTRNLSEAAAIVYLLHEDNRVIQRDVVELLRKEREFVTTINSPTEINKMPFIQVDSQYLNCTATLCGTVKNRTYELCGVATPQSNKRVDILDVGCGTGIDLIEMSKRISPDSKLCGIDIDEELIGIARQKAGDFGLNNVHFKLASSDLPIGNEEYDCVRSERLFQHLREPDATLYNMLKALKVGGRLVIADTDWNSLTSQALSEEENCKISSYYANTLTNKNAVRGIGGILNRYGVTDFIMEKISIRLEQDDYMRIIKSEKLLKDAFDSDREYQAVIVKLRSASHLPMFASLDMIVFSAVKPVTSNANKHSEMENVSSVNTSPMLTRHQINI